MKFEKRCARSPLSVCRSMPRHDSCSQPGKGSYIDFWIFRAISPHGCDRVPEVPNWRARFDAIQLTFLSLPVPCLDAKSSGDDLMHRRVPIAFEKLPPCGIFQKISCTSSDFKRTIGIEYDRLNVSCFVFFAKSPEISMYVHFHICLELYRYNTNANRKV